MTSKSPVVLCILDGWGLNPDTSANAVAQGETPNFDRLMDTCPNATLTTFGPAVGLPEGQMGNSEVGHMNIGAGRVVWMDLPRIDNAIESGEFRENAALNRLADAAALGTAVVHIAGLASPGGVHAHQRHMAEAARVLTAKGLTCRIHAFTDGRDVAPRSAAKQIRDLEALLPDGAEIATVSGRYYAMDRDNRWDRVARAYNAIAFGQGAAAADAVSAIEASYAADVSDEFVEPAIIGGYAGVSDGDCLLFVNFRADRAREILAALADPGFDAFETGKRPGFAAVCGMVEYSDAHNAYMDVMFPAGEIVNTLSAWVAAHGLGQFHIAETEKYPHVTFFLAGGKETPEQGEVRYMAPSPKVATYDLQPEMSAAEVTDNLIAAVTSGAYALIVVNYANPDMVGHTGDLEAAKTACSAVDRGVGALIDALEAVGGTLVLTADHGNCETMVDPETGGPHTAHTLNPVPVVLWGGPDRVRLRDGGALCDLAPTLLELMGLPQPAEMTGKSLIQRADAAG